MAERVTLVDDLDLDSEATRTVRFGLGGKEWLEIDLSDEHADALETFLEPYISAARRVGVARARTAPAAKSSASLGAEYPRIQVGTEYWVTPGSNSAPYVTRERYKNFRQQIRDWGNANGYPVSGVGRIPPELGDAYARHETGKPPRAKAKPEQGALDHAPRFAESA